jgi:Na+-translocating ferredoxin:NAD+ oxidoreductase RnfD subunit
MRRRIVKFFSTPKGLLILILAALLALAAPGQGWRHVGLGLAAAIAIAGGIDMAILRIRKKVWEFPSGAVLSAMIVAMVLRAQEPWYVLAFSASVAVVSKYVFRSKTANVFNPAALAIIVSFYVFHTGQSWWGALVDMPGIAKLALLAGGAFITDRVNKMPLALTFLGAYFALFTVSSFLGKPLDVAEIFRTPDAEAALYFAVIILTDPPTSPAKYPDQIVYGLIVAIVSFAVFEITGVVYYLLAGLMTANVWEAWRRVSRRTGRTFPQGVGTFLREITLGIPAFSATHRRP